MNRTCITLIVFLFLNIFSVNANLPKITEYTLENGLTVILCESDEIPSVLTLEKFPKNFNPEKFPFAEILPL